MTRIGEANDSNHLDEIEDGAGCVEIWERLSEARDKAETEADDD